MPDVAYPSGGLTISVWYFAKTFGGDVNNIEPGLAKVKEMQRSGNLIFWTDPNSVLNGLKGGDIDLQRLAKLHRDNPNMLTGNTATVAQFASDHPEVTGGISDNTRISPPSVMGDLAGINPLKPLGTVGQALFGAVGRRLLRGPNGEAIGAAMQAPVAGLGGEFDPRPPGGAPPPPPTGSGGLADDLSASPSGISATPIKLGNSIPGQRGAVGAPVDISGLRQLQNTDRTYTGMTAEEQDALKAALEKLKQEPRTYGGTPPLGKAF